MERGKNQVRQTTGGPVSLAREIDLGACQGGPFGRNLGKLKINWKGRWN